MRRLWNKAPAIWFPWRLGTSSIVSIAAADGLELGISRRWSTTVFGPAAREFVILKGARLHPRKGDERLSGRQQGESDQGKDSSKAGGKDAPRDKGARKQRASELGRALRSIYDDTLRESVPDDFNDLLGKLR